MKSQQQQLPLTNRQSFCGASWRDIFICVTVGGITASYSTVCKLPAVIPPTVTHMRISLPQKVSIDHQCFWSIHDTLMKNTHFSTRKMCVSHQCIMNGSETLRLMINWILNYDQSYGTELFDKVDDNITGLIKFSIRIVKNDDDDDDYNKYKITNSNDNKNTDLSSILIILMEEISKNCYIFFNYSYLFCDRFNSYLYHI